MATVSAALLREHARSAGVKVSVRGPISRADRTAVLLASSRLARIVAADHGVDVPARGPISRKIAENLASLV